MRNTKPSTLARMIIIPTRMVIIPKVRFSLPPFHSFTQLLVTHQPDLLSLAPQPTYDQPKADELRYKPVYPPHEGADKYWGSGILKNDKQ